MMHFVASILIGAGPLYYPAITSTEVNGSGYIEQFVQRDGVQAITKALLKANTLARQCNRDRSDACALNNPAYQEYLMKVIVPHGPRSAEPGKD